MLCIKKQFGTIFAIASPALLFLSGFWDHVGLLDAGFAGLGTWLASMLGFVAVLLVTGVQVRHSIAALQCFAAAIAVTLLAATAVVVLHQGYSGSQAPALVCGAWRFAAVMAMTGMVVSLFTAAQVLWRYANANHPAGLAACSGFVKSARWRRTA